MLSPLSSRAGQDFVPARSRIDENGQVRVIHLVYVSPTALKGRSQTDCGRQGALSPTLPIMTYSPPTVHLDRGAIFTLQPKSLSALLK